MGDIIELRELAQRENLRNRVIEPEPVAPAHPRNDAGSIICRVCYENVITISDTGFVCRECRISVR